LSLIVVSGGQSGVDRAALDWALRLGWEVRGWCPAGRRAEDGAIDLRYPLRETPSRGYAQRTRWNVRDSDGTLILNRGPIEGGTAFTLRVAERAGRPFFVVQLEAAAPEIARSVAVVIDRGAIRELNIAGPRESGRPGIYDEASRFLEWLSAAVTTVTAAVATDVRTAGLAKPMHRLG
jgi:hypothetical protein